MNCRSVGGSDVLVRDDTRLFVNELLMVGASFGGTVPTFPGPTCWEERTGGFCRLCDGERVCIASVSERILVHDLYFGHARVSKQLRQSARSNPSTRSVLRCRAL